MASSISAGTTSSTALVATADTSGALVLQTNNGTTALTLSTAQNATFAGTLATSSRGITQASMPAGSVIQVVQGTTTNTQNTASTTVIDTTLTATITPTSSASKILVLVSQRVYKSQTCSTGANMYLQRGATNLLTDARVGLNDTSSVGGDQTWSCCYLDSPATTSATTYKTQFANNNGTGQVYTNLDSNQAQITLMEIAV
jgi:hypothetical protein